MESILDQFISSIKDVLQDNLISIILFGSKAREDYSGSKSDYNLLLVLKNSNYNGLEKLDSKLLKKWTKSGNPVPFVFTEEEFLKSTEVFPIEFIDMMMSHKVLYGKDLLQNLKIDDSNLRHECEYELKSKLLQLRQQWLLNRRNRKALKNILTASISSILTILKHVVKLSGEKMPEKKIDAPYGLSRKFGIDPEIFKLIYAVKHQEKSLPKFDPEFIMKEYLKQLDKIVSYIDHINDK